MKIRRLKICIKQFEKVMAGPTSLAVNYAIFTITPTSGDVRIKVIEMIK